MNFNKVILLGNLTREVDFRTTPGGLDVARLGLAVNRKYRAGNGREVEERAFVDVTFFAAAAVTLEKYLSKGDPLLVEGRLKLEEWQTRDGDRRSKLVVVGENFQFVGGRSGSGGSQASAARADESGSEEAAPPF